MLSISREISTVLNRIVFLKTANGAQTLSAFHTLLPRKCANKGNQVDDIKEDHSEPGQLTAEELKRQVKDRSQAIPVEVSIRYLKSAAYKQTYGEQYVWEQYRRNHKGHLPPKKTRKTCIRKGALATGNPCPICRDEYLVLDHHNIELLRQFISPQTGKVLSYSKTGLCQKKHLELLVAVERAWDYGLIIFDVPFREYDYSEYFDNKSTTGAKTPKA